VSDAELGERPADLGELRLVDLPGLLGRDEIMPAPIGVERAIFGADSRAVIEMLRLLRANLLDMDMTALAVLSIDDLLAGLGSSEASLVWYREKVTSRKAAGEEYRRRKTNLRRLLGDPEHLRSHPGGDALARVLAARRNDLATINSKLDSLAATKELFQPKSALVRTCLHLHCNRLGANQLTEDQILDLLGRTRHALDQAPLTRTLDVST
jgi:lantibiotic biosynthesis protein